LDGSSTIRKKCQKFYLNEPYFILFVFAGYVDDIPRPLQYQRWGRGRTRCSFIIDCSDSSWASFDPYRLLLYPVTLIRLDSGYWQAVSVLTGLLFILPGQGCSGPRRVRVWGHVSGPVECKDNFTGAARAATSFDCTHKQSAILFETNQSVYHRRLRSWLMNTTGQLANDAVPRAPRVWLDSPCL
jgi:hypothetical protein